MLLSNTKPLVRGSFDRISIAITRSNSTKSVSPKWEKYVPRSGLYPKGFVVGGHSCGIKKPGKLDLALLVSETPCNAAAVFTTNKLVAAPVIVSKKILKDSNNGQNIQSVVINSGCANAITGAQGIKDAEAMAAEVDKQLKNNDTPLLQTLVMSTGVIGQKLPLADRIIPGIRQVATKLGSSHDHWLTSAKAIMTTDTFPKLISKSVRINDTDYNMVGVLKGAGMISPNMATMLGYIATDAPVSGSALSEVLQHAAQRSYNCVSVDGDMSTNDTVAILANGAAGGPPIENSSSPGFAELQSAVTSIAQDLAKLLVRDGEGATKFVTITVKDCSSFENAKTIATSIANSSLVKTALYGCDANWGRILAAIGYASVDKSELILTSISVSFLPTDGTEELKLLVKGEPQTVDEVRAKQILEMEDLEILVDIGTGKGAECQYWTCDLSHEYITINADYRS